MDSMGWSERRVRLWMPINGQLQWRIYIFLILFFLIYNCDLHELGVIWQIMRGIERKRKMDEKRRKITAADLITRINNIFYIILNAGLDM